MWQKAKSEKSAPKKSEKITPKKSEISTKREEEDIAVMKVTPEGGGWIPGKVKVIERKSGSAEKEVRMKRKSQELKRYSTTIRFLNKLL